MTEQEAIEGLNREQRRKVMKLVKKGMSPEQARIKALEDTSPDTENAKFNGNTKANKSVTGITRFIRKSNG